jgi:hypothetical protein
MAERVLFNHLQAVFSEVDLAIIANEHPQKVTDTDAGWDDHYWITL